MSEVMDENVVRVSVQDYYGRILKSQRDLQTSACCPTGAPPAHVRAILPLIHSEIRERSYGCGSPIPAALEDCTVLDLGCGTGQDAYVLSKLVGPRGRVIGVDMTPEQLTVARRHTDYQRRVFGHEYSNVDFMHGYIEDLAACGIGDASIDIVVSNCVLNLAPDKSKVFAEIFRVLKPGGELYFSDVFADRRLPREWLTDTRLVGECLAGALYLEDFRRLMAAQGCLDVRYVSTSEFLISNEDIKLQVGNTRFYSVTVRAFKLPLEDRCEDHGQVARYLGTIPAYPHSFVLDDHHLFATSKPALVCGNTADMLSSTRYARHFQIMGDKSQHFGLFDCSTPALTGQQANSCC
jgi:ubiquinone/menaquinone biosynthesis C-methylase UbiE